MTTEIDDWEEAESHNSDADEEENLTLSIQLLRFHDDFNNMLAKQEFYGEAISALLHIEDCDVLYTERQRSGMMSIGRQIRENGSELSDRLGVIRDHVRTYLG